MRNITYKVVANIPKGKVDEEGNVDRSKTATAASLQDASRRFTLGSESSLRLEGLCIGNGEVWRRVGRIGYVKESIEECAQAF